MVPRFGGHGGGHGQPALRVECDNHGGIFPLSTDGVNLHRGEENVAKDGKKGIDSYRRKRRYNRDELNSVLSAAFCEDATKNQQKKEVVMITLTSKQTQIRMIFVSILLGLILALWPKPSFAQMVASQQQAASVLAIENSAVQDGTVSGVIRNKSPNTVRDVQLFIRYTWLWANEFHPGKDNPSEIFYQTVSGDITPGGSLPFKFTPSSPLPKRSGGKFAQPTVSVAGFTQVISQK